MLSEPRTAARSTRSVTYPEGSGALPRRPWVWGAPWPHRTPGRAYASRGQKVGVGHRAPCHEGPVLGGRPPPWGRGSPGVSPSGSPKTPPLCSPRAEAWGCTLALQGWAPGCAAPGLNQTCPTVWGGCRRGRPGAGGGGRGRPREAGHRCPSRHRSPHTQPVRLAGRTGRALGPEESPLRTRLAPASAEGCRVESEAAERETL